MSIATHALKFGWVYLASLTLGTGTIFMVNPVLNRITLHDRAEVFLGIVERCYATQTGTNTDGTPIYAVAPPEEVRTWTDTNGASVTVTNSIEWRDDLSMKYDMDVKLKALCPYYVDTNSVFDGTTNIVMCTFTGLLTSLNLGDHTNFTSIPALGTNAATFGPWAWRNYIVAWQERYKVLNALKITQISPLYFWKKYHSALYPTNYSWEAAKASAETSFLAAAETKYSSIAEAGSASAGWTNSSGITILLSSFYYPSLTNQLSTSMPYSVFVYARPVKYDKGMEGPYGPFNSIFYDQGLDLTEEVVNKANSFPFGLSSNEIPSWIAYPSGPGKAKGFRIEKHNEIVDWQFNYCTNKYW
jgi:hypothetical protein